MVVVAAAAAVVVAAAVVATASVAAAVTVTVTVEQDAVESVVAAESVDVASEDADEAEIPATAALISSAVASSTRRFWVKMQPLGSFASSQLLPARGKSGAGTNIYQKFTHPCPWNR